MAERARLGMLYAVALPLLVMSVGSHAGGLVGAGRALSYYVQGAAGLAPFLPAVNSSFSASFGKGLLFALNATAEMSRASQQLGFVRGFTIETSYLASEGHRLEVAFLHYDDGHSNGTVQIQGEVLNAPSEVAIVGGTGSFRGARGYLLISLVNATENVFLHELYFA